MLCIRDVCAQPAAAGSIASGNPPQVGHVCVTKVLCSREMRSRLLQRTAPSSTPSLALHSARPGYDATLGTSLPSPLPVGRPCGELGAGFARFRRQVARLWWRRSIVRLASAACSFVRLSAAGALRSSAGPLEHAHRGRPHLPESPPDHRLVLWLSPSGPHSLLVAGLSRPPDPSPMRSCKFSVLPSTS